MRIPEFFRPHRDPLSLLAALAVLRVLWELVRWIADAMDALGLAQDFGPDAWQAMGSPVGIIVLLIVAVVANTVSNKKYGGSALRPEPQGKRAQRQKTETRQAEAFRHEAYSDDQERIVPIIEQMGVSWQGLKEAGDPHAVVTIPIVNSALRMLEKGTLRSEGRIRIDGHEMRPPSVTLASNTNHSHIHRGERGVVAIRQEILPEMVTHLVARAEQRISIQLSGLSIFINARFPYREPDPNDVEWRLILIEQGRWNGNWNEVLPSAIQLRS